jgi:hypothetical protein
MGSDEYNDAETKQRMDDALRRALTGPHKPNQAFVGAAKKKPSRPKRATKKPAKLA